MEKENVKLEVFEYSWYCPMCKDYNFLKAGEAWEDDGFKDVMCDTCEIEFTPTLED